MELRVKDSCLSASGGSYIAHYDATLTTFQGDVPAAIQVINTIPEDADTGLVAATIDHITRGVESVLRPRRLSGVMTIRDLVIHEVDCKPRQFEIATARELTRLLADC